MSPQPFRLLNDTRVSQGEDGETSMALAVEINLALWIMMGCLAKEAAQFIPY